MISDFHSDIDTAGPFLKSFKKEPLLAEKDGYVVLVVDETLEDIPSWVEWDHERGVISISHMGGGVAEAKVNISPEYLENLRLKRKLLLVSNDGKEKLMHYIAFLAK